jgi:hypothetical protein
MIEFMAQYIDKDALVAEIEGYISNYKDIVAKTDRNDSTWIDSVSMIDAKIDVLQHLLSFLNTLEVKEIDFHKELYKAFGQVKDFTLGMCIARHFYELGLKTKKGE